MFDPLWNPPGAAKPAVTAPAGKLPAQFNPAVWRAAQVAAAPELNGMTAAGAWTGVPWFVPGPAAGAPYYA